VSWATTCQTLPSNPHSPLPQCCLTDNCYLACPLFRYLCHQWWYCSNSISWICCGFVVQLV